MQITNSSALSFLKAIYDFNHICRLRFIRDQMRMIESKQTGESPNQKTNAHNGRELVYSS